MMGAFRDERGKGLKLYVNYASSSWTLSDVQLLPSYSCDSCAGVVDSDDLPLNVSRELLQQNRTS